KNVLPQHGGAAFWSMLLAIAGLTLFNHFFCIWLKRKVNINGFWMLGFFAFMLILFSLDFYFEIFSIRQISTAFFRAIIVQPLYALITVALALIIYLLNHSYLRRNLYLDELNTSDTSHKSSTEIPFLDRFGKVG